MGWVVVTGLREGVTGRILCYGVSYGVIYKIISICHVIILQG